MNFGYVLPRLARRLMPDRLARALLRRGWVIRPGLETRDPLAAASRYLGVLQQAGIELAGKRILIFGYGGNFALGCLLLRHGAGQVTLCDKFAPPDHARNARLLPEYGDFLAQMGAQVVPTTSALRLLSADILQAQIEMVDIVLSTSVYEHLEDVEGITRRLAELTTPGGVHLHYIDLRDHHFKYPFEMLTFSERAWRRWLNPSSNLNRWRLPDYARMFAEYFEQVEVQILASEPAAFAQIRPKIRPEFLSGDDQIDAATLIQVLARNPLYAD